MLRSIRALGVDQIVCLGDVATLGVAASEVVDHTGAPRIMSHAEYASVEVRDGEIGVTLHRVPLDRGAVARAALDSTHPMRDRLAAPYL